MFIAHTNKTLVSTCEYQCHQNRRLANSHFLYNKEELVIDKFFHISSFVTTFTRVITQGCSKRDQLALECLVTENRHDGAKQMKPMFIVMQDNTNVTLDFPLRFKDIFRKAERGHAEERIFNDYLSFLLFLYWGLKSYNLGQFK